MPVPTSAILPSRTRMSPPVMVPRDAVMMVALRISVLVIPRAYRSTAVGLPLAFLRFSLFGKRRRFVGQLGVVGAAFAKRKMDEGRVERTEWTEATDAVTKA